MQCEVVDISIAAEVKMRGKRLNVSPKVLYLFPQLQIPLSSYLFCPKRENETVLCVNDGKLYCDILLSWFWEPRGCTSLSLCRKGKLQQEQIDHRVKGEVQNGSIGHCDKKRENR